MDPRQLPDALRRVYNEGPRLNGASLTSGVLGLKRDDDLLGRETPTRQPMAPRCAMPDPLGGGGVDRTYGRPGLANQDLDRYLDRPI
jgi:hypothetical protein